MNWEQVMAKVQEWIALYGLKVIAAIIILFVGWIAAKLISAVFKRMLTKVRFDAALVSFVSSMTYVGLMAFVIIAALGQLGVQTTSLIAVIGAAGLA